MTQPNCKPPITQKKLHTTLIAEPKIDEVQHQSPMYIPSSTNYIVSEILTKGIKMTSHFNFWTACPAFKWSANLVNYHRLVRCNAAMKIIHDSHLKQSCTAKQM